MCKRAVRVRRKGAYRPTSRILNAPLTDGITDGTPGSDDSIPHFDEVGLPNKIIQIDTIDAKS